MWISEYSSKENKEFYDSFHNSLNDKSNLEIAKKIVKDNNIISNIPRDFRIAFFSCKSTKKSFFGLFKSNLEDEFDIHVQFDGNRLRISRTSTDNNDYGMSSYAEFADLDLHYTVVDIDIKLLCSHA